MSQKRYTVLLYRPTIDANQRSLRRGYTFSRCIHALHSAHRLYAAVCVAAEVSHRQAAHTRAASYLCFRTTHLWLCHKPHEASRVVLPRLPLGRPALCRAVGRPAAAYMRRIMHRGAL